MQSLLKETIDTGFREAGQDDDFFCRRFIFYRRNRAVIAIKPAITNANLTNQFMFSSNV